MQGKEQRVNVIIINCVHNDRHLLIFRVNMKRNSLGESYYLLLKHEDEDYRAVRSNHIFET